MIIRFTGWGQKEKFIFDFGRNLTSLQHPFFLDTLFLLPEMYKRVVNKDDGYTWFLDLYITRDRSTSISW